MDFRFRVCGLKGFRVVDEIVWNTPCCPLVHQDRMDSGDRGTEDGTVWDVTICPFLPRDIGMGWTAGIEVLWMRQFEMSPWCPFLPIVQWDRDGPEGYVIGQTHAVGIQN